MGILHMLQQIWKVRIKLTNKITVITTRKMKKRINHRNCELGSDIQNSFLLYKKQPNYCFFSIQNIA
jgi:hypothetical protein